MPASTPLRHRLAVSVLAAALFALAGCDMGGEDPLPPGALELTITANNGTPIGQTEALTITARVTPVPDEPLTFYWETVAQFGRLRAEQPFGEVIDETTSGSSQVLYSATPVGNPGGPETITVRVFDADGVELGFVAGSELVDGEIVVEVESPQPQTVSGVTFDFQADSGNPGRVDHYFYSAWVFDDYPGFGFFALTVLEEAGEGWDVGNVGTTRVYERERFYDVQGLIDEVGYNPLGLDETQLVYLVGARRCGNLDPTSSHYTECVETMRASQAQLSLAVYAINAVFDN